MDKEKLNVILFNDNFEPCVDGVIKTVVNYANLLNKDSVVSVVCPRYSNQKNDYPYPVYRLSSLRLKKQNYAMAIKIPHFRLVSKLKKQNPKILHVHSPFMIGHFALRLSKKLKVPLVSTFHSKYKDDFLEISKSKFLTKLAMKYIMSFYNKCDCVWTCSKETKETLRSYGYKGEVTIIENGTDYSYPDNIETLKNIVIDKYKIDKTKNNILFVGQIIWQKNIKLILDVASSITKTNKNFHFYFVGTSLFEKQVKEYARSVEVSDYVTFTGVINDTNILKGIYASCDLFFFPSLYDNAPLVLREAASMKLPSLVTLNSTCSEVIKDNYNGYIEIGDIENMKRRILDLFKDKTKLKECGEIASSTIPISWEVIISNVKSEYLKIIDNYDKKKK